MMEGGSRWGYDPIWERRAPLISQEEKDEDFDAPQINEVESS